MHHVAEDNSSFYVRVPAKVLGCLRDGEITVILLPVHGLALTQPLEAHLIPETLRMPNSEFDILFKHPGAEMIRVLCHDEPCPEIDKSNE
ncbi:hypothetical protein H6F72_28780 [Trichocoleus sp. FACHB-46]|nr:hypothetical protein [Trichocoleus sp. FACHB-46]